MDSSLFTLLACPKCHGELTQEKPDALTCSSCQLAFPIENGLPILLIEKAISTKPATPAEGA